MTSLRRSATRSIDLPKYRQCFYVIQRWFFTTNTQTFINGQWGHYFKPQLLGTVSVNYFGLDGSGFTDTQLGVTVGAKYYFKEGKKGDFTPFVQGEVGLGVIQNTFSGTTYSATGGELSAAGGGTYWLTESAGINIDGRYRYVSYTLNNVSTTENHFLVEAGLTYKF